MTSHGEDLYDDNQPMLVRAIPRLPFRTRTMDDFWNLLSGFLPRKLVYWAVIRAMVHATTGKWSGEEVPAVKGMDILQRWEHDNDE